MMRNLALLGAAAILSGCAGPSLGIQPAGITVTGIALDEVNLHGQSLRIEFLADNPNPFPLPVRAVKYELRVGNERIARGESASDFSIPARGSGAFALDLETDVLQTVPRLGFLLLKERVDYEVDGSLAIDLPFARPIPFSASGNIELRSRTRSY